MRLFLDTEFNGFGGSLISMALVSETGEEWYEVAEFSEPIHPWVAANVLPVLGKAPIPADDARRSLHAFLALFREPEIVADWYTDLALFFGAFAGRDHGGSLDYACTARLLSIPTVKSAVQHNALHDARALRDWVLQQ